MVDSDRFRDVMGTFGTGVTVVTLPEPYHGITVNAFASVSLSPPLVLVCLDHETEAHTRLGTDDFAFGINILAGDSQYLGEHFARIDDHGDPFQDEAVMTAETDAPIFESALSYIDCSLESDVRAGDHTIYIGAVEAADILRPEAPALTYFNGDWGQLSND